MATKKQMAELAKQAEQLKNTICVVEEPAEESTIVDASPPVQPVQKAIYNQTIDIDKAIVNVGNMITQMKQGVDKDIENFKTAIMILEKYDCPMSKNVEQYLLGCVEQNRTYIISLQLVLNEYLEEKHSSG